MKYEKLGNSGITVSRICFGSLTLGPMHKDYSPEKASEILLEAFRSGINFVDTAQLYRTYPHIRAALEKHGPDIVVATKTYAYTAEMAKKAIMEARSALNRDVIDIFLLHEQESAHTLRGHAAALECLYDYKAKGVIRSVGISTHHVTGVHAAVDAGLDIVHPLINIAGMGVLGGTLHDMEAAIARAVNAGIGVYTMKALGGGNLFSRSEEALRYALKIGHSLAIGMSSIDEVHANTYFLDNNTFKDKDLSKIKTQKRKILIEDHCGGCGCCISSCKAGALEIRGSRAVCNIDKCVLCGYCGAKCENFCIKIV